jgi:hypothetical protein
MYPSPAIERGACPSISIDAKANGPIRPSFRPTSKIGSSIGSVA